MAGIIGIYGLVVSVLIANDLKQTLPLYTGFIQLGAGLAVGLAGMAAGYVDSIGDIATKDTDMLKSFAIGIVGDAGVRGSAQQPRLYVGMILILIFAEVLGRLPLFLSISLENTCLTSNFYRSLWSYRCLAHELELEWFMLNGITTRRGRGHSSRNSLK